MTSIPQVQYGSIGGSNTFSARFPEDFEHPSAGVRLVEVVGPFETPYGESARFKLIEIAGELVLRVGFHGCIPNKGETIVPWIAAEQVAWVFAQAGVKYAITDGSVGGIQPPDQPGNLLPPWSAVIPEDFLMSYVPPVQHGQGGRVASENHLGEFYRIAEPFCPGVRAPLYEAVKNYREFPSVHNGGIYACTRYGRFETKAEIEVLMAQGATVVGQTIAYEAAAMRPYGIHFAALDVVSNHAEGRGDEWTGTTPSGMAEFYKACPQPVGSALLDTFEHIIQNGIGDCRCHSYVLTGMNFPVDIA